MKELIEQECKECIKLFGYSEMRCAFCKDKEYYLEFKEVI